MADDDGIGLVILFVCLVVYGVCMLRFHHFLDGGHSVILRTLLGPNFKELLARIEAAFPRAKLTSPNARRTAAQQVLTAADITAEEVIQCQVDWANAIKTCSKIYSEGGDYVGAAAAAAGDLYGYGHSEVLFKPTQAAKYPFRPTGGEAMSYFVGGKVVKDGYTEDGGFAINGGKGWSNVVFNNHRIDLNGTIAIAMGEYAFTCATTNEVSKVEYTFGYKRNADGKARIFLHHSSVPYQAIRAVASCPSLSTLQRPSDPQPSSPHHGAQRLVERLRSIEEKHKRTKKRITKSEQPSDRGLDPSEVMSEVVG